MQISVEPGGLSASAAQLGRAGATFAAMSQAVGSASGSASAAAGSAHAQSGLVEFGEHWSRALQALAFAGEAIQQQLDATARHYVAVDADITRAALPR